MENKNNHDDEPRLSLWEKHATTVGTLLIVAIVTWGSLKISNSSDNILILTTQMQSLVKTVDEMRLTINQQNNTYAIKTEVQKADDVLTDRINKLEQDVKNLVRYERK